jgi:hypothetical protein
MVDVSSEERRFVDNWLETGAILDAQRKAELRALTPERAAFLADALFSIPWPEDVMKRRRAHSGLLEMQDLLRGLRPL